MTEGMKDSWDPFLDAYSEAKEGLIAYDELFSDVIEHVFKAKKPEFEKKIATLRKEYINGQSISNSVTRDESIPGT